MRPLQRLILAILFVVPGLICDPAIADLSRNPSVDFRPHAADGSTGSGQAEDFSAEGNESLLDLGYGIEFWKKGRPYLGLALADGPAGLPSEFESIAIEPHGQQISPLLVLFFPVEECARHPYGRFRLYGGIGPGVSLIQEDPFDDIGHYTMDIGVDVRFGFLWTF